MRHIVIDCSASTTLTLGMLALLSTPLKYWGKILLHARGCSSSTPAKLVEGSCQPSLSRSWSRAPLTGRVIGLWNGTRERYMKKNCKALQIGLKAAMHVGMLAPHIQPAFASIHPCMHHAWQGFAIQSVGKLCTARAPQPIARSKTNSYLGAWRLRHELATAPHAHDTVQGPVTCSSWAPRFHKQYSCLISNSYFAYNNTDEAISLPHSRASQRMAAVSTESGVSVPGTLMHGAPKFDAEYMNKQVRAADECVVRDALI